jgi:hypothetical protein
MKKTIGLRDVYKKVRYVDHEGFEYIFEPIAGTIKLKKTKDGYEARYLSVDTNPLDPFENDEGMGGFYHWKGFGAEQLSEYCRALAYNPYTHEPNGEKENPDAVRIDKYEHSQVYYSISGEGHECRWDTSHDWAVWLPNKCLLDDLKRFRTKATRRKRCVELARQACEVFNQWANGDVYVIVKEMYDKNKEYLDHDSVGGYYGFDEAVSALDTEI